MITYQENIIILGIKSALIKKEFNCEPVYNNQFLKSKIKPYAHEVTDFYDKEVPKVDSNYTCLAVMSLDSDLNKDGNYYPQVFLKVCKYIEKKVIRHVIGDLESSSEDSDEEQIKAIRLMFFDRAISNMYF